jgi:hypothetical protein
MLRPHDLLDLFSHGRRERNGKGAGFSHIITLSYLILLVKELHQFPCLGKGGET